MHFLFFYNSLIYLFPCNLRTYRSLNHILSFSKVKYYKNQDDNYKQDHYQFHWNQRLNNVWVSNLGLHYTYGRGYYENYNVGYHDGGHKNPDFIDRRWLDNDFYGMIFNFDKETNQYDAVIGGSYNIYDGQHFGEYLWRGEEHEEHEDNYKDRFYDDTGKKKELNLYAKVDYHLDDNISIYGDLQLRNIIYNATFSPYSSGGDVLPWVSSCLGVSHHCVKEGPLRTELGVSGGQREQPIPHAW